MGLCLRSRVYDNTTWFLWLKVSFFVVERANREGELCFAVLCPIDLYFSPATTIILSHPVSSGRSASSSISASAYSSAYSSASLSHPSTLLPIHPSTHPPIYPSTFPSVQHVVPPPIAASAVTAAVAAASSLDSFVSSCPVHSSVTSLYTRSDGRQICNVPPPYLIIITDTKHTRTPHTPHRDRHQQRKCGGRRDHSKHKWSDISDKQGRHQ